MSETPPTPEFYFTAQARRDAAQIAALPKSVRERLEMEADWPKRRAGLMDGAQEGDE